jgi:hypothetical protein
VALAALSISDATAAEPIGIHPAACERLILYANLANGQIFEMVDSRKWKVIDAGIADTRIWGTGDEIEACGDGTLLNVDTDEQVDAKRIK